MRGIAGAYAFGPGISAGNGSFGLCTRESKREKGKREERKEGGKDKMIARPRRVTSQKKSR